jgi:hypothetical protein
MLVLTVLLAVLVMEDAWVWEGVDVTLAMQDHNALLWRIFFEIHFINHLKRTCPQMTGFWLLVVI